MFTSLSRLALVSATALVLTTAASSQVQAQLLGQSAAGWDRHQQPQQQYVPPVQVHHWYVINVTTYVQHQNGTLSSVTWEFTTHVYNNQSGIWEPQQWGATYIRAIQGLRDQGWSAYDARSHSGRQVTGTW